MEEKSIYQERGYKDRDDYLSCLSDDYDISLETVLHLSAMLGPSEDFDGLIVALQDEADRLFND
jgi:hypothetical protein